MKGHVDDARRALLEIDVGASPTTCDKAITVWIDTAFDGFLVFPESTIKQLGLRQAAAAEAILADGSRVTLASYLCYIKWFGKTIAAQVVANDGKLPLLGTELLSDRRIMIDYATNELEVN